MSGDRALRRAVRPAVVVTYTAQLGLVLGVLTLPPAAVCALCGDGDRALRLAITAVALAAVGWVLGRRAAPRDVQTHEAMVIAALAFALAAGALAWPLAGPDLGALDAVFEAVSGVTTTGLSTLDLGQDRGFGFWFLRAWMQWFGGFGIVALSLALMRQPGSVSLGLAFDSEGERDPVRSARGHARTVAGIYVALTAAGVAATALMGASFGDAVLYTMSAVSTGGFAPRPDSLASLPRAVTWTVSLVCLLGAMPLLVYLRGAARPDLLRQVALVLGLCAAGTAMLAGLMVYGGASPGSALVDAALLAVSAQSTAGFAASDVGALDPAAKLVLLGGMLVGGAEGSTAGGVKVLRLLVAARVVGLVLARPALPAHAVQRPTAGGRALDDGDVRAVLAVLVLYAAALLLSWLPFVIAGHPPIDALFDVGSALGTVGLSAGVVDASLAAPLKGVLCVDMLLGRLEIVAWLIVLRPATWFGPRRGARPAATAASVARTGARSDPDRSSS
ncbi:MAG: TrkH family potassium uptake protein [Planctomycetota bacterium]